MNFEEANEYLSNAATKGSVYGLESIIRLTQRLGNPQKELKMIHVAGTNGKGSTVAFISTILKKAGYKVGIYTSPSVVTYWERIQINGEYITKEAVASLTSRIAKVVQDISDDGFPKPTVFEIETAMAFLYFKESGCDISIIETGMGGRMDATNLIDNTVCSVIASISMDHMGFLGNNLTEIAQNKAGIIKPGAQVISLVQKPEAMRAIEQKVNECECSLKVADIGKVYNIRHEFLKQYFSYEGCEGRYENIETGLHGIYQIDNAILAIETIDALRKKGFAVSDEALAVGIRDTIWYGRFTKLLQEPLFIIDGAHNEDAAKKLRETIEIYFTNKKIIYIMGVLADKEYDKIIDIMIPLAEKIFTVTPNNPRALSAKDLANKIKKYNPDTTVAESVDEAVRLSIKSADKDTVIISFGSLYYLGEVIEAVKGL